ncbi:LacI family DNA-binding transcriptional regulator [Paracoccus saliphilus]|uniref:LacI family DNA-binding transcriptional regulator n=1 Tax=Paracoccus saliphilus TaxID=405559 RepID=A0AA46A799_9RHOB|nr:LacI family DNA-binding transcriptional regulator [Paracoccus saliphilus]WCR03076.1 LacI family DNA-binding transcriptional regulator [Paracoccus saliphilus]SIT10484.1 transcriptional regulator, LacI family [Paracoccus saliphilus]
MDKGLISSGRARLSDVAKLAGVSTSTVSRVLSCPDLVAETTRQAVTEALAATGYRMNHAARNLRKQRTGSVVALVPNLGNPFFAKILDGMGKELAQAGYDLLVADTLDDAGRHTTLQRFMDASRADGIILMDGMVPVDHLRDAHERTDLPPLITACEWVEDSDLPRVMLDNREGARLAIQHLRELGHRHIGVIGGPDRNVLHKSRLAGVHDAADGMRLTLFEGDFTLQAGKKAAKCWEELSPDQRPGAVFAFSDEMACAFMASLQRNGIIAPRDISIVGFDDIELGSHLAPALTTIRQPKRELGRQAARTILQRITGAEVDPVTLLAPQLMLRETTAPFTNVRIAG